jgi:flagellar M-ring protein FliF
MRDQVTRALGRGRSTFAGFTTGQKAVTVLGTLALLLGGFMVFRWASTPEYGPLYSNLSASDASAVVDQLDTQGTPYELTDGGSTVMVPRDQVYATRIALSGEGLPADSDNQGYSILDDQGMSLSQDQQDVNFKRAMEGELSKTIEAIDGVETAVVHLAIPQKEVFAEEQDPVTASVLVKTRPGTTLDPEQVQAVVNLVASSVDGLDPDQVTVADATGAVLSAPGQTTGDSSRNQMVSDVQDQYRSKLQAMLDRVLGAGNSTVQVTAVLDFDDAVVETTDYSVAEGVPPRSQSSSSETYNGPGSAAQVGGVVGTDGNTEVGAGGAADSSYQSTTTTQDNAIDKRTERRASAPGSIESLNVGVALDSAALARAGIDPTEVRSLVVATAGIDKARGDKVAINELTFDRTSEEAAAKALKAADAEKAAADKQQLYRNVGLGVLVALMVLLAVLMARRRAKKREETTAYLVEQLRADQLGRVTATQIMEPSPAELALAEADASRGRHMKAEIDDLIARQPDDVAALLRGWLAERP